MIRCTPTALKIPTFQTLLRKVQLKKSKPIIEEVSLSEAIEDFKLMAKVEGQADKTLELYDYVFKRVLGFLPVVQHKLCPFPYPGKL